MSKAAVLFTQQEAAELAEIKPALLKLWIETEKVRPSRWAKNLVDGTIQYYFVESDIPRLVQLAASQGKRKPAKNDPFVDDGRENFTVAEIASLRRLSNDTVRRLFQDEPGVVALGDRNPRGKRRRVTLRIPRAVMERVKKRRSNPT